MVRADGEERPVSEMHPDTTVIHAGRGDRAPGAPTSVPPFFSSTFVKGSDLFYGRHGNPTWEAFEEAVGALEDGTAFCFASGMAAIAAVFQQVGADSTIVLPDDCYAGTRALAGDLVKRRRAGSVEVDITDVTRVASVLKAGDLLWIESPSNPLLKIADIPALAEVAHSAGARVVVDNTFATPLLQRPLELGADIVVHSGTKFLSGHSDVLIGVAVTRDDELAAAIYEERVHAGGIVGPMEAFLALRGLRTLHLRIERACSNAAELAERLTTHPPIRKVHYPGLPDHPGHALAARQMAAFGAVLSFEMASVEAADDLCRALRVITHTTSLGGVESSLERRGTWEGEERTPESLIRMSVGCENIDDLWSDLSSASSAPRT